MTPLQDNRRPRNLLQFLSLTTPVMYLAGYALLFEQFILPNEPHSSGGLRRFSYLSTEFESQTTEVVHFVYIPLTALHRAARPQDFSLFSRKFL